VIRRGNGNQSGIVRRRDGGRRRGIGDHSRGCDSIRLRFHEMTQPLCLAGRTRLFRVVAARMCRLVGLQSQNLRTRKAVSPYSAATTSTAITALETARILIPSVPARRQIPQQTFR